MEVGKKEYSIEVPEDKFSEWLTGYRSSVVKRDMAED